MSKTNEPETLCVEWLSSCQRFTLLRDLYYVGIRAAFSSLDKKEEKLIGKLTDYIIKNREKTKGKKVRWRFKWLTRKLFKFSVKKCRMDALCEKMLDATKFITAQPIVGAIAVKYPHNNSFSVFIGIGMGEDEEADIAYIKRMGQRTTEGVARGIFPQFDDMEYHN